ncbi:hypothetical protein BaRGS_00018777 [Batillaria attramentaria]|uniref:Apple domain-containing protein n=1 Tax=Batillaria attramentaria TaxID=370345 RepID=A0ABD0KTH9_9CAEN
MLIGFRLVVNMQWTLGLAFTLLTSFAGCDAVTGGAFWENKWLQTGPNDIILTDGVLFDVAARSKIECARLCAETSDCVTFTSAQSGAAVSCRGHSSSVTLGSLASAVQWERVLHRTDSTPNVPLNMLTTSGDLLVLADLTTAAMTTADDADLTTAAMTTAGDADLTTAAMTTAGDADLTTAAMTTAGDADLTTAAMTTAGDADLTTAAMTTADYADLTTAAMTTAGDSSSPSGVQGTSSQSDPMTFESVTTVLSTIPGHSPSSSVAPGTSDQSTPLTQDSVTSDRPVASGHSSSMASESVTSAVQTIPGYSSFSSVAPGTSGQSTPIVPDPVTSADPMTSGHPSRMTPETVTTASILMTDVSTSDAPARSGPTSPATAVDVSSQGPVEVPVIGSACNDDSDCVTSAGFACFVSSSQCLCIPGYYFSEGSNACVTTCDDLLDTFMVYPDSGTDGANIQSIVGGTVEDCKAACVDRDDCLTFEYNPKYPSTPWFTTTTCNLQDLTPITARSGDWNPGTDIGWDTYQRRCA